MKSYYFLLITIFFFSCEKIMQQPNIINNALETSETEANPENLLLKINNPIEIDSSGIIMFPLKMKQKGKRYSSSSYKTIPENQSWNMLFYNSNTNETHLLSEEKMLITSYNYKTSRAYASHNNYIFYEIIKDDWNADKLLNSEDPTYLFVSDKKGKNFKQISPKNHDLVDWITLSNNKLILFTKIDKNKNKKFDKNDEIFPIEVSLDSLKTKEIISPLLKTKLKELYDRDWKKIEQN